MNIGDKVRFLSEVGGGVVSGFQGKDIVLVQDEDGFDIPMAINDVVVVDADDYNIAKVNTRDEAPKKKKKEEDDEEWLDRPVTFQSKPQERRDGDKLNVALAFVPVDPKSLTTTAFRAYLVNDSNYYLSFIYMAAQNASWQARYQGAAEPNTKVMMEEFFIGDLADTERVTIQAFAYKVDKPYQRKPVVSVEPRIDGTKFYRANSFKPSPFFKTDAIVIDLVKDDQLQHITTPPQPSPMWEGDISSPARTSQTNNNAPSHVGEGRGGVNVKEVDLHINELLDDTRGLSDSDLLRVQMKEFARVMEEHKGKRGQRIVFIHGKGEGVLRTNILKELAYRYKGCTVQDASFREYGYGATMVTIK